jgi:hypothetical protein
MESAMNAQEDRLRRCDRCGAVAKVQVQIGDNLELLLCRHHADKHNERIAGRYPVQSAVLQ